MFQHFLRGIFRGLLRRKVYALINLASLTLGLAVFAFAFLYVKKELGYDRGWPDAELIHRLVIEQQGLPGRPDGLYTSSVGQTFPALRDDFPDHVDKLSRVYAVGVRPAGAENVRPMDLAVVDPDFVEIFGLEVTSGSLDTVFGAPGFIALHESYAAAYPEPLTIGSRVDLEGTSTYNGQRGTVSYEVAAFYRTPDDVSDPVRFGGVTVMNDYALQVFPSIARRSWDTPTPVWLRLKPGIDAGEFDALMPAFVERTVVAFNAQLTPGERIGDHLRYRFQKLTDLHLHPIGFEAGGAGDPMRVLTVAAIGVLVLLAGCSNSISLGLASVLERRREIGIRKAAGAQNSDLLLHYLGESMLLAMFALVPALLLVKLLSPPFAALLGLREALHPGIADYLVLLLLAGLAGLLNGAYPAFVLSAVKPEAVLKVNAIVGTRGAQGLRTLIVGFQFSVALTLMLATLALYAQLTVARVQPLGFSVENVLFVSAPDSDRGRQTAFIQELRNLPAVKAVSVAGQFPNISSVAQGGAVIALASKREVITESRAMLRNADAGYFDLLEIPLLAGRGFDAVRDARDQTSGRYPDQREGNTEEERVILNGTAAKALGFATPQDAVEQLLWRKVRAADGTNRELSMRIVGVVEDNMYNTVRYLPGPEIYYPLLTAIGNALVRFDAAAASTIQQEVRDAWQRVGGINDLYFNFLETYIDSAYQAERNESRILLYCAGLALFLSSIGLYGLAAFTMERRIKEVGIRKVLGAEQGTITRLYLWRYARPVLLASIVAVPVAVYFVLQWMQRFPYQMERIWLLPLAAGGAALVLAIALLTVTGVVLKAARSRPVLALRYE